MASQSRDSYFVNGSSVEELKSDLNFILQRIADRLDKMEGLRGTSSPAFSDVAVGGNITVTEDDTVIHAFERDPLE